MVTIKVPAGSTITTTLLVGGGAISKIEGEIIDPPPIDPPPIDPPPIDPPPEPGPEPIPPPENVLKLIEDYGAVGDGRADDTNAVQRACDDSASSGKTVIPGKRADGAKPVFILNARGTCSMQKRTSKYCIALKSHTRIDGLKNCEFKLGARQDALMFTNADQNGGNTDIHIARCEGNGHRSEQSGSPSNNAQENGFIGMDNVTSSSFVDLHAWNVKCYAGNWMRAIDCNFTNLRCDHSDADGWNFGLNGAECRGCTFHDIWAENTAQNYTKMNGQPLQGNPLKLVAIDCTFSGKAGGAEVTGGVKPQGTTRGLTFDFVDFFGGPRSTANSGLKLQGDQQTSDPSRWVKDIRVKKLRAVHCAAEGLRMSHASSCLVEEAELTNCGISPDQPSMVFREVCHDCRIGKLTIKDSKGVGVECRKPDVQRVSIGELYINGCTHNAIRNGSSGTLTVDYAEMRNCQANHASAAGKVHIKHLKADKALTISGNVQVDRFERL